MANSRGVEALPERLDVGDWLDEDVPSQVGAGGAQDDLLAVVRHDDPDAIADLVTALVRGHVMDGSDLDEIPEYPEYDAPQQSQFDDLSTYQGRYPANDLTI